MTTESEHLHRLGWRECRTCKTVKPLDQFHRDKAGPMGRTSHCAKCRKAKAVQARLLSKEVEAACARLFPNAPGLRLPLPGIDLEELA